MLIEPTRKRVRVFFSNTAIADSIRVKLLLERNHTPVYYFPPEDVRTDLLQPSNRKTRCPHKGEASYWTIDVGGRQAIDAAWSYADPVPGAKAIEGHLAFYRDRADAWFEEDDQVYQPPR